MKLIRFTFNHPFKGKISLLQLSAIEPVIKKILVDTKISNSWEIPIDNCRSGKWRIVLDWEPNERAFTYSKDFNVLKKSNIKETYCLY